MKSDIEICKWYNNADCPVILMIDDLANVWVDTNGNGQVDLEEDWGYAKNNENSSFRFLNEAILKDNQEVKVTFFTPVGIRVGMTQNPKINSISKMINCDEESKEFFREINKSSRFEIAYHGTTHGRVGKTNLDFIQEWELFNSLEEAVNKINYGKEIYKEVFGEYPKGGKYCGYGINEYSDVSIDNTGFLWWCRYWNRGKSNENSLTNFDIKTFGKNKVCDIPSTIDGSLLNGALQPNKHKFLKKLLRNLLIRLKLEQISFLLKNKLVISIQEHMAPSRDDGRRQSPNIFDDKESLKHIFKYLKSKRVWYCTGSELAEYVYIRDNIKLLKINENKFNFTSRVKFENIGSRITVKIVNNKSTLVMPNLEKVEIKNGIVSIPILRGTYELI